MSKCLCGNIGCKYKTFSWHLNGLLLSIRIFGVLLSLQLKKLRRHIKSARGHKDVRRSAGHIMATTRYYSDQQGSKSRQNPCQVQRTENIGNLTASRRCVWVRTTVVSTVWSAAIFQNLNHKLCREDYCLMCCPSNKVIKSDTINNNVLPLGGVHEDKSYATLYKQWHRPAIMSKLFFIKSPYSISRATSIESDCCRLPMANVLSNILFELHLGPSFAFFSVVLHVRT